MEQTINQEQAAQVRLYILELREQNKLREAAIQKKISERNGLQEYVGKSAELNTEIDDLRAEQRNMTKFVETLISFAERASGKSFKDEGPLFEENHKEG